MQNHLNSTTKALIDGGVGALANTDKGDRGLANCWCMPTKDRGGFKTTQMWVI